MKFRTYPQDPESKTPFDWTRVAKAGLFSAVAFILLAIWAHSWEWLGTAVIVAIASGIAWAAIASAAE